MLPGSSTGMKSPILPGAWRLKPLTLRSGVTRSTFEAVLAGAILWGSPPPGRFIMPLTVRPGGARLPIAARLMLAARKGVARLPEEFSQREGPPAEN